MHPQLRDRWEAGGVRSPQDLHQPQGGLHLPGGRRPRCSRHRCPGRFHGEHRRCRRLFIGSGRSHLLQLRRPRHRTLGGYLDGLPSRTRAFRNGLRGEIDHELRRGLPGQGRNRSRRNALRIGIGMRSAPLRSGPLRAGVAVHHDVRRGGGGGRRASRTEVHPSTEVEAEGAGSGCPSAGIRSIIGESRGAGSRTDRSRIPSRFRCHRGGAHRHAGDAPHRGVRTRRPSRLRHGIRVLRLSS